MDLSSANAGLYAGLGLCAAAGLRCAGAAARWLSDRRQERQQFLASLQEFEDQIDRRQEASAARPREAPAWKGYRRFVVQRIVAEADDISSIYLAAEDRRGLPKFKPGQFLTLRIHVPGAAAPVVRCYSLSDRPRADYYRITVKAIRLDANARNQGKVSRYLNRGLRPGDVLESQAPRGEFYLRTDDSRPAVLIAAGIGITPLLSMTSTLLQERGERKVILLYGIRNSRERAFHDYLREQAAREPRLHYLPCYSQPLKDDLERGDKIAHRRIDMELLRRTLPDADFPFYVCGPASFMENIVMGLQQWGVAEQDLHFEAFGPSSLKRSKTTAAEIPLVVKSSVRFQQSDHTTQWDGAASLLELGEADGVALPSGCRSGNCGMCAVRLLSGKVRYPQPPDAPIDPGFCLACVAQPESDEVVIDA